VTVVKSLSDTQPAFGCASGPVDVHWYVEGSGQVADESSAFVA